MKRLDRDAPDERYWQKRGRDFQLHRLRDEGENSDAAIVSVICFGYCFVNSTSQNDVYILRVGVDDFFVMFLFFSLRGLF